MAAPDVEQLAPVEIPELGEDGLGVEGPSVGGNRLEEPGGNPDSRRLLGTAVPRLDDRHHRPVPGEADLVEVALSHDLGSVRLLRQLLPDRLELLGLHGVAEAEVQLAVEPAEAGELQPSPDEAVRDAERDVLGPAVTPFLVLHRHPEEAGAVGSPGDEARRDEGVGEQEEDEEEDSIDDGPCDSHRVTPPWINGA